METLPTTSGVKQLDAQAHEEQHRYSTEELTRGYVRPKERISVPIKSDNLYTLKECTIHRVRP